jgi:hypothetical protein
MGIKADELLERKKQLRLSYPNLAKRILKRRGIENPTENEIVNLQSSVRYAIMNPRTSSDDIVEEIVAVMGGEVPDIIWNDSDSYI